jgi:4-oxalocrotonate tautomerase
MPIIKVELLEGRTREQKRELAQVLTRETARITQVSEASIFVVIDEVKEPLNNLNGTLAFRQFQDQDAFVKACRQPVEQRQRRAWNCLKAPQGEA